MTSATMANGAVFAHFSAAYSINVAIQYPLFVPLLLTIVGILLKHHMLASIGSAGGVVLAGSVAHYYDWKPFSETNTMLTVAFSLVSLYLSTFGPAIVLVTQLLTFVLDYFTIGFDNSVIKSCYWTLAFVLHKIGHYVVLKSNDDVVKFLKIDILMLLIYAGLLSMLLGKMKNVSSNKKEK